MSMAMTWSLVKKDFLLAKRFGLLMLALGIAIPLYMSTRTLAAGEMGVFVFMTLYTTLVLGQYVAGVEAKYPKAEALLFASPYTRRCFVVAKYMYFLIVFGGCSLVYLAMGLIPAIQIAFVPGTVLATLVIACFSYGIVLPIQLKLGVDKVRVLFMVFLLGVSFGTEKLAPLFGQMEFGVLRSIPGWAMGTGAVILALGMLWVSMCVSIRVYERKEI